MFVKRLGYKVTGSFIKSWEKKANSKKYVIEEIKFAEEEKLAQI